MTIEQPYFDESAQAIVSIEMKKRICVIGGGLAGGITASTLAANGHDVTLVELGDAPTPLIPGDEVWQYTQMKAPFTRGKGTGGTSNFWHGGLIILDKTDVESISDRSGYARIPIAYSQLRDYYARALALMRAESGYSVDDIEAQPKARVCGFGTVGNSFRLKALLYPGRPFSTRPLIERAKELYGLHVIPNVEIKRLLSSGLRRVTYAEGVDVKSGDLKRIDADVFVLSAGGLGSPKILLESARECPALESLPIGRFIIDHPTGFVFKAKLGRRMNLRPLFGEAHRGFKLRYGFALNADRLSRADSHNHILFLRPAISMKDPGTYDFLKQKLVAYRGRRLSPLDIAYLVRHSDLLFDAINFKFGLSYSTSYVSGLVFAEQFPNEDSRMCLSDNGKFTINWNIAETESRSLEKFLGVFFENYSELFETFKIFSNINTRLDSAGINTRLDSAGHHSGTCRMAKDAAEGVVDADLRVFGIDNLFAIDGSVLPFSGHANTGLTIAALALKCCDAVSHG